MRKFSKGLNRFIALLLVFILGFTSCIGAIVGVGFIAYSKLSIDFLEELGIIDINDEEYISAQAEVSLSAMTIQGLIAELQELSSLEDAITVEMLLDRYGLTLSEDLEELLPEGILTVSFDKLFTSEGISYVLDNTKVDYLFKFVPEGVISEPAKAQLANKTFADVMRLDLGYLLDGVCLGYLLGVKYELDFDGEYIVVYEDPTSPTLFELIAPLRIGELLSTLTSGGDLLKTLEEDLGNVMIQSLVGAFIKTDMFSIEALFGDKEISDILVLNEETGNYTLEIMNLFTGRTIGDILDYDPIIENGITVGYYDKDGNKVTGMMRGLAATSLDFLSEETIDLTKIVEDVYLGDLLEYDPVFDYSSGEIISWNDSYGDEVGALEGKLAEKTIGEIMGDDFEVSNIIDGMLVGDMLGHEALYEDSDDPELVTGWRDENGKLLSGLDSAIANIDLGKLMNDPDYEVTSVLDGVMLGDVMGNTPIYNSNGEIIGWRDEDHARLKGLDNAVANIDIGRLVNDPTYKIEDAFNDVYIGEMLGYEKGEELPPDDPTDPDETPKFKWYEIDDTDPSNPQKTEVTGVNAKFSNYILGKIISGEEELSADSIAGDLTIAEVIGLESKELFVTENGTDILCDEHDEPFTVTVWYDSSDVRANGVISSIADYRVDEFDSEIDNLFIGAVIGLFKINGEWVDTEEATTFIGGDECLVIKKAEGLICHMADLTIADLKDPDAVDGTIQDIYVGEVLGHKPVYDTTGDNILYWLDGETNEKLTGFIGVIAGRKVGEIDNSILDELTIADVMDYERHCDLHTVESEIVCPDDCSKSAQWYKFNGSTLERVKGVMAAIAGYTISSLDSEINNLYLGDVMGYTFVCTHCDSTDVDLWCDECKVNLDADNNPKCLGNCSGGKWINIEGEEIKGVMASFVNLTVDDMSDNDKVTSAIQNVTISDAMGYRYETRCTVHSSAPNSCTSDHCSVGVYGLYDKEGNLVKGFMKSIADKKVSQMDGIMDELTVAEVMGYTYDDATKAYYDGEVAPENKVGGIIGAVAECTIGNLDERLSELYIGEVMDCHFKCVHCESDNVADWCLECQANVNGEGVSECTGNCSGGLWYNENEEPITGVMSAFATLTVDEMKNNDKITEAMRKVSVGEAMGYESHCIHCAKVADALNACTCDSCSVVNCTLEWYESGAGGLVKISGIMKTIANSDIGHLNEDLDNTYIGDILGYRFDDPDTSESVDDIALDTDGDGWWYDDSAADDKKKTTPLINRLSGTKIGNLSDALNNLTINDVFTEEEMDQGFLKLFSPGPGEEPIKLSELGTKTNEIFENTTMGEYYEAGLIVTEEVKTTLDNIKATQESFGNQFDWENMNLNGFVTAITGLIPTT